VSYPGRTPDCGGHRERHNIVLGTGFPTDIALFSLRFACPLAAGDTPAPIALRTLSEAPAWQACLDLEIEFALRPQSAYRIAGGQSARQLLISSMEFVPRVMAVATSFAKVSVCRRRSGRVDPVE
jgi:hypothetical protein